ncbi:DNA glycosylase [Tolypocladium capitatum]|uniref:DNA glycosylase n=1 Tax=Tolypocladium capitatum TaxID=45235 RepID=A0A2K3PSA7_9HYPO|nr:DNA glycosylase [Tolypocladium capitatum]
MASTTCSHATAPPRRSARNVNRGNVIAIETEEPDAPGHGSKTPSDKAARHQARKRQPCSAFSRRSPFPGFAHPTPDECVLAHGILASLHGDRARPEHVLAPAAVAGCGSSPSVLDALVRTVLSQNTRGSNSSRAKQSMDAVYGGRAKLQRTIRSGGLGVVKSGVIIGVLQRAKARHGAYSLDHLFAASDDDAMRELLSFPGVGPKTASCVLLIGHGKQCDECKAGART